MNTFQFGLTFSGFPRVAVHKCLFVAVHMCISAYLFMDQSILHSIVYIILMAWFLVKLRINFTCVFKVSQIVKHA